MSTGYLLLLILIIVLAVLVLLFVGLVWYVFKRPLARARGEIEIPAIVADVEVVRDRWGVPHIYAASERDAWVAQGFVHAQDRLFQMEYARRLAQGTLAEAFGPAALEADRWSRIVGLWRAAQADLQALDPEEREVLAAYAAGVNAYLAANRLRLPAEYTILGLKPAPWAAQDSLGVLKVLGWALSQNWEGEVLRLQLHQALGPERAAELEPFYPAASPVAVPSHDAVDPAALADGAGRVLASHQAASRWLSQAALAGSNTWAIGPQRTATRRPLLANDPHLNVSMPTLWYENHLEAHDGSVQVAGASIPGVPGIITGHNAAVGWGITAGRADTQDLFVELRHPQQPAVFQHDGRWEEAQVLREEIAVRGQDQPVVEEVILTRHGPLINGLLPEHERQTVPALALRWTGHEAGHAVRGLLCLQKATDWASFRAALADVGEPSLNVAYADVAGNIGYQYAGRVPQRRAGYGIMPSPGWNDTGAWTGIVPFDELPSAFNPPQGHVVSANNKPAADDYSHFLGVDWFPGYRAARIEKLLQAKPRYTVPDFQHMQIDVYSVQAEAIVPFLTIVSGDGQLERRIVRELETWNLHVEMDSFPAAAYEVMRLHLLDLVFGDKLGVLAQGYKGQARSDIFAASSFSGKAGLFLANLLEQEESWWYHDAATGQSRSRDEILKLALRRTADSLYHMIGKDPRKWAWGKVHQVEFAHVFGRGRFLRALYSRGPYPIGGDETTIWMTAQDLELPFGLVTVSATYRQVLDVGDWDRSTAVLATGQSCQPLSVHYADHIDLWREGEQHAMLWTRAAVDAEAAATLWLRATSG